ncbi:hypothetical protein ILYODFUR_013960 [Ilyodon furcidens]|uniref:Uncharacterized protein n=1 Tax=Ilyodon furcidens TaxID=33524 RepID=A0ABV0TL10_9TELE
MTVRGSRSTQRELHTGRILQTPCGIRTYDLFRCKTAVLTAAPQCTLPQNKSEQIHSQANCNSGVPMMPLYESTPLQQANLFYAGHPGAWTERHSALMSLCWQTDITLQLDPRVSYDHRSYALS